MAHSIDTQNIKAILFDLGNVVFELNQKQVFSFFSDYLKKPEIQKDYSPLPHNLYESFEKGLVHYTVIRAHLERRWQGTISNEKFIEGFNLEIGKPFSFVYNFISDYRQKIPMYVLSNTNEIHINHIYKIYPELMQNFTRVFTSFDLHMRKPDLEIYRKVIDETNYSPNEILFLDDRKENIDTAHSLNMQSIWISDVERLENTINYLRKNLT